MILYAQWDHAVIVTFVGNGGTTMHGVTGSDPPVTQVEIPVLIGDALGVANLPTFTHENAVFSHWNFAQATLPGTTFDPTQNLYNDITVYARWNATVTFVGNGGYNVSDDEPQTTLTLIPLGTNIADSSHTWPVFARRGYIFEEWNTETDGSGDTFIAATAVNGNMSVYAQWEEMDDEVRVGHLSFIDHPEVIDFGTPTLSFSTTMPWRLGEGHAPGATPIEDVYFTIGNPQAATGWRLWASATPDGVGANLAPLLRSDTNLLDGMGTSVYQYTGDGAADTHSITWATMRSNNRDVHVLEIPGQAFANTYTAYLHWTLVPGS